MGQGQGSARDPGRRGAPGRRLSPSRPRQRPSSRPGEVRARKPAAAAPRPRLTGRFAVLVLVVAVLAVSYASSLRAYLDQRHQLSSLREEIASSQADIAALEKEQDRWQDPAYQMSQARERFGFVLPGEVGLRVIGRDGEPLGQDDSLSKPQRPSGDGRPEWWQTTLRSIDAAGDPPDAGDVPAQRITPKTPPPEG